MLESNAAENCSAAAFNAPPNLGPIVSNPDAKLETKSLPVMKNIKVS